MTVTGTLTILGVIQMEEVSEEEVPYYEKEEDYHDQDPWGVDWPVIEPLLPSSGGK